MSTIDNIMELAENFFAAGWLEYEDAKQALRTAIEQALTPGEPVATVTSESKNPRITMSWWHEPALPVGTKLYTHTHPDDTALLTQALEALEQCGSVNCELERNAITKLKERLK